MTAWSVALLHLLDQLVLSSSIIIHSQNCFGVGVVRRSALAWAPGLPHNPTKWQGLAQTSLTHVFRLPVRQESGYGMSHNCSHGGGRDNQLKMPCV